MDSFISSVVFILPGFMMYFWIQSFGVNPVVKHSPVELTAISGLLWLPVSVATLGIYNLLILLAKEMSGLQTIWSLDDIKEHSSNLLFLVGFLLLSILMSFLFSLIYVKWLYPRQAKLINRVRSGRGLAPFSDNSSVWDEIFTKDDMQVVQIGKIDKINEPENSIIGSIKKASRPFEVERNLHLDDVDFFTNLVRDHKIPVSDVFLDTKSGTYVKIFDPEAIHNAQLIDLKAISSSDQD